MLPAEDLKPVMDEQINETVEVLGAPASAAAILLREHKWAKETLFQSFFDNPEKVQEKCGVLNRCQSGGNDGGDKKPAAAVAAAPTSSRRTRSTRVAVGNVVCHPSVRHEVCSSLPAGAG